jgi:hypothetical protein
MLFSPAPLPTPIQPSPLLSELPPGSDQISSLTQPWRDLPACTIAPVPPLPLSLFHCLPSIYHNPTLCKLLI